MISKQLRNFAKVIFLMNQNSTSLKFDFLVTGAYEVLGNFRLRKLYDKGMIQNAGERFENDNFREKTASEEDDPTTRFYKARMKKEHSTATGRTPIYDFDVRFLMILQEIDN